MFRRMFGGDNKGGQAVSQSAANKTVDAIQKLGEVSFASHHARQTAGCMGIRCAPRASFLPALSYKASRPFQQCWPCRALAWILTFSKADLWGVQQTEELLVKRRNLLEKKVDQETERAKEFTRQKNKRGELVTFLLPSSALAMGPCK